MSNAADTILALLRTALPADVKVYDTLVPGVPPNRYVVAYIPAGARSASTITGRSEDVYLSFQTTSVATDPNAGYASVYCRWLQTVVINALTDTSITADGWARGQIKHDGSQYPQPDEATPDKKVYATDQFSLETVRI